MLEKMSMRNILFSFLIGAVIGTTNQLILSAPMKTGSVLLGVFMSGAIGLLIGIIIEFVLVLLPVSIAKPSTYFFINNAVALFVTAIVIVGLYFYGIVEQMSNTDLFVVIGVAFVIIVLANTVDFFRYKKANIKLREFKTKRKL